MHPKTITQICDSLREQCGNMVTAIRRDLQCHHVELDNKEAFPGQHSEMFSNMDLALRHLEDARMRLGKVIQYAGDGVSKFDKPAAQESAQSA
ncbi:MAG: hypothetical protein GX556_16465 [Fibrobacter sp.]|nr:hypothetical protein [Fibrobacter sp.]